MYRRLLVVILLFLSSTVVSQAQDSTSTKPLVFLMKLDADIDPRTNRYTELALEDAVERNADYVVIEMDTYGGALNDADDIRTRVLEFEKPIYVFINKDAASAGALISIACDSIYMAKGASIGAATVVTQDGAAAPDKYQSYMRSIMRSTAEANGRDPKIAEAMVDQDVEVDSISTEGKVITFSTSEAIKHGFCEAEVKGLDEIMDRSGVAEYDLFEYELTASDKIIDIFINPFVSGILILVILGGIYFELQTPGVGFPILAALIALVLYFTPYYLNGLAENWEIIIFFLGVVLLAVEIFVIPGFGVAGISGITLMMASLILVMLNNDWFDFSFVPEGELTTAMLVAFLAVAGAFVVMFIGGVKLTESRAFKRIALETTLDKADGYTSNFKKESFIGKNGIAYTILRPSGKVEIDNEIYDAYTRGGYIEQGTDIVVIAEEGTSLKVKAVS
ncbi:MAG: NfeD family protein [Reichenbachiella sp.]|uniref:NfeD family protein n=1 Tax=Reichenbachiella sp. TaxID=2184521 RepID=UPI0032635E5A